MIIELFLYALWIFKLNAGFTKMENKMSINPSSSQGKKDGYKRSKGGNSSYKMNMGERKLPRPIVFWSDNEKDAFRRNKIVQTKYHILLEEIETQQKVSQRNIKFEAHKFRQKSAKLLRDTSKINLNSNSTPDLIEKRNDKNKVDTPIADDESVSSEYDESEDETDIWNKDDKRGKVITKSKKSSVKFSVYTETFPSEKTENVQTNPIYSNKSSKQRCMSASQRTYSPDIQINKHSRSKSVIPTQNDVMKQTSQNISFGQSQRKNSRTPDRHVFFDKSYAAYSLRQELQKLAKLRKRNSATPTYDVHDYLRMEREKYSDNRLKVTEYLRNFDRQDLEQEFGD